MTRSKLALALVAALALAGCYARGPDQPDGAAGTDAASVPPAAPSTEGTASATSSPGTGASGASTLVSAPEQAPDTSGPPRAMFGTLPSPCGPGAATIAGGQNGGPTLRLGTATDHGYEASPGLTVEMLDAAEAFAAWCNEQGGIGGLRLEIVDLDAKLFQVPPAMEQACAETFAMVGGGWVFDDQMFPRFHECGMISFPAYTVTPTAAMANGKMQPIPNPANVKPAGWLIWASEQHPDAITASAIVYGDFLTTQVVADQLVATMDGVGGFTVVDRVTYNPAGEANWAPFAQRLLDGGVRALFFIGPPADYLLLAKAMDEIGYSPEIALGEANLYDATMVTGGNAALTDGFAVRTAYSPFEEADRSPGMQSYLDIMATFNPDGKVAGLGLQSMSAMLLFAEAANACLAINGGVLERECVLAAGATITGWTGGGLHSPTDPGSNLPPPCNLLLQVRDGAWRRLYPELGSADDNGEGWHCDEEGVYEITGDFGDVASGVDPTRPT